MSIIDDISYDAGQLQKLDTNGLLLQVIARQDLRRPKHERRLTLAKLEQKIKTVLEAVIDECTKLEQPRLTRNLQGVFDRYFDVPLEDQLVSDEANMFSSPKEVVDGS